MTISKLIQELEDFRDAYGPDIEVRKSQPYPLRSIAIKTIKLNDFDEDPAN